MPKQRNTNSHRTTEANKERTARRVEEYYGLDALIRTWEAMPDAIQIREHDYILELRRRLRNVKNYIQHRGTADSGI